MTKQTDKGLDVPEVIYLIDMGDEIAWCDDDSPSGNEEGSIKYVRADTIRNDKQGWVNIDNNSDISLVSLHEKYGEKRVKVDEFGGEYYAFILPSPPEKQLEQYPRDLCLK